MKKCLILGILALFASGALFAKEYVMKPHEIEKTAEAVPKKLAFPQTKKVRNILVYSKTEGYRHSEGIAAFNAAMEAMEKNFKGAWKVKFSEDPTDFEAANLKKFDCVILNNTTGRFFSEPKEVKDTLSDEEKRAVEERNKKYLPILLEYVENGGGLVGVHAACDAQGDGNQQIQKDFVEMMGARFAGHPWGAGEKAETIIVEDPTHILLRGLWKDKEFQVQDEIYTFIEERGYSRDKQRVLMSIDYYRSPLNDGKDAMTKTSRKTKDFGLAWVKLSGKGRVFYGAFGHRSDIFYRNPDLCEFYMRGIQFACGDIRVADPTRRGPVAPNQVDVRPLGADKNPMLKEPNPAKK